MASQTRCFTFVEDTVRGTMLAGEKPEALGEAFNIGSTEEISIANLARLVITTLNSRSEIEFVPYAEAYAPGFDDMRRRKPKTDKLKNALNFRPAKTLQEIIRLTAR